MDGWCLSSEKLVRGFAQAIRRHYPDTTRVRRVGEAVNVRLKVGLGFDVVPCFSMKPHPAWRQPFYLIPDGENGWLKTNPRRDKDLSDRLHRDNDRCLRPAVELFKLWNGERLRGTVGSYFSELGIMISFERLNLGGRTIRLVSEATAFAFRAVRDAVRRGDQPPLLDGAPPVGRGSLCANDLAVLDEAVVQSDRALGYERHNRTADALSAWAVMFGDGFPTD